MSIDIFEREKGGRGREREREREIEREKHPHGRETSVNCLPCAPWPGSSLQPVCARKHQLMRQPPEKPGRGSVSVFKMGIAASSSHGCFKDQRQYKKAPGRQQILWNASYNLLDPAEDHLTRTRARGCTAVGASRVCVVVSTRFLI